MRARIVLAGAVMALLAAGALAAPVPKTEPVKLDAATQAKVRKLQVERRDALREALAARQKEFLAGRGTVANCLDVSASLLSAELDLATKAEERLAAHAAHLKIASQVEDAAKQWYDAGRLTVADYQTTRAARLEAEIGWLKAGGGKEKGK
jgi:hypothetical protein